MEQFIYQLRYSQPLLWGPPNCRVLHYFIYKVLDRIMIRWYLFILVTFLIEITDIIPNKQKKWQKYGCKFQQIFVIHQEKVVWVWGNFTILSNINYTFPLFSESWFWLDKQQCPNNFNDLYYKRRLDNLFTTFCLTKVPLIRSLCNRVNKITPTMFVIIHQPNLAISAISARVSTIYYIGAKS